MVILLKLIGTLGFIAGIIGSFFLLYNIREERLVFKNIPKVIGVMLGVCFLWYVLSSAIIIEAGDRGVIFNNFSGVKLDQVLGEGFHIVPAVVNNVTYYDVYTRTWTEDIPCLSSDGLPIAMDVSIRYRMNADKVAVVKQNVGGQEDVEQKILIPTARSKMRDIAAKFTAQEAFAHKRMELQKAYENILTKFFAGEKYLIAEQILVRKVVPPADLTKKIQETKVAEQEVLRQKNILAAEKQKKEQKIVQAQAEAAAIQVKAKAEARALSIKAAAIARNPKIIKLEWINKWDGTVPKVMLGEGAMPLLDMGDIAGKD
jgi:regulator of protease activity HflC (stomatin/prohibitin superfamily)